MNTILKAVVGDPREILCLHRYKWNKAKQFKLVVVLQQSHRLSRKQTSISGIIFQIRKQISSRLKKTKHQQFYLQLYQLSLKNQKLAIFSRLTQQVNCPKVSS